MKNIVRNLLLAAVFPMILTLAACNKIEYVTNYGGYENLVNGYIKQKDIMKKQFTNLRAVTTLLPTNVENVLNEIVNFGEILKDNKPTAAETSAFKTVFEEKVAEAKTTFDADSTAIQNLNGFYANIRKAVFVQDSSGNYYQTEAGNYGFLSSRYNEITQESEKGYYADNSFVAVSPDSRYAPAGYDEYIGYEFDGGFVGDEYFMRLNFQFEDEDGKNHSVQLNYYNNYENYPDNEPHKFRTELEIDYSKIAIEGFLTYNLTQSEADNNFENFMENMIPFMEDYNIELPENFAEYTIAQVTAWINNGGLNGTEIEIYKSGIIAQLKMWETLTYTDGTVRINIEAENGNDFAVIYSLMTDEIYETFTYKR